MDTNQVKTKGKRMIIEDDTTIIFELMQEEMQLIKLLRSSLRFGEVTIIMRNGVPVRIKRIEEFININDTGLT